METFLKLAQSDLTGWGVSLMLGLGIVWGFASGRIVTRTQANTQADTWKEVAETNAAARDRFLAIALASHEVMSKAVNPPQE